MNHANNEDKVEAEHRAFRDHRHVLNARKHLLKHKEHETIHEWKHALRHDDKKDLEVEAVQLDDDTTEGSTASISATSAVMITGLVIGASCFMINKRR